MTDFNNSQWAKPDFARAYRDNAEVFVIERRRLFAVVQSFYRYFMKERQQRTMLDLGCGDGVVTQEILKVEGPVSATLLDGSEDMLNSARERLKKFENVRYVRASFQDVLYKDILKERFDFVVSSLAIHHLMMAEKRSLFRKVYSHLSPGGCFANIDVVLAPSEALDQWYMPLWKEWINEKKTSLGIENGSYDDIIYRYKENKDNKPDTLKDQLNALCETGFRDVDCFYKYGIFCVYGGRK